MPKSFLPRPFRHALFRDRLKLPVLDNSGLHFKPAESTEEFFSAFRILHDSYVEFHYMKPCPSGLRVTPYHLLPGTVTLIIKEAEKVVGTVSIVRDSPLGLPMDKIFDLAPLRQGGLRIAEISSLAIRRDYRWQKGALLHRFIRYLWKFSCEYLAVDTFVCAVNPAMYELYESIYLFRSIPHENRVGKYDFVNGAPAVGLVAPAKGNFPVWERFYGNRAPEGNLFEFISRPFLENEFHFEPTYYSVFQNSMRSETRERILRDPILDPTRNLSIEERFKILCQLGWPKRLDVDLLKGIISPRQRSERFEVFCPIPGLQTQVLDVSSSGLKLAFAPWDEGRVPDFLPIRIGPEHVARVKPRMAWKSRNGLSGHEIVDADSTWEEFISHLQSEIFEISDRKTG